MKGDEDEDEEEEEKEEGCWQLQEEEAAGRRVSM